MPLPSGFPIAEFSVTVLLNHFELPMSTHLLKNEHKEQFQSFPTPVMYRIITFELTFKKFFFGG